MKLDRDFKYEVGQYSKFFHDFLNRPKNHTGRINEKYKDKGSYGYEVNRYRIEGLWYSEDEIDIITPETHPEYFI